MQVDDLLGALYEEARQRFETECALINRLAAERGSSLRFIADFGHLAARAAVQQDAPNLASKTPPPLPEDRQGLTDDELDQEWFNRVIAQRDHWQKNTA